MSDKTIVEKMLFKPGQTLLLVDAPDGYEATMGALPDGARVLRQEADQADVIQVFVKSKADLLARVPPLRAAVKPGGIIWITYPKGGAKAGMEIHRDIIWELVREMGLQLVAAISVDDVWSALRAKVV
ncbi:MAG: hypothetical protein ACYC5O_21900 [Anaerolineae bacterium]